jgi:hypothetical protein
MATTFRNVVVNGVGTTLATLVQTTNLTRCTVIGLSLTNITNSNTIVDVLVEDDTSTQGYYAKGIIIPPGSSLRVVNQGEKLIMATENQLLVRATQPNSIDAIVSFVEIY